MLQQARGWSDNENVTWSDVAREYSVDKEITRQLVKEFLSDHAIPAAKIEQCNNRRARRSKPTIKHRINFPMSRPISYHKKRIKDDVNNGTIQLGEKVVENEHTSFVVAKNRA